MAFLSLAVDHFFSRSLRLDQIPNPFYVILRGSRVYLGECLFRRFHGQNMYLTSNFR